MAVRYSVLGVCAALLAGCGGSSSETPPPLPPSPFNEPYRTRAVVPEASASAAPVKARPRPPLNELPPNEPPARGTWGGGRPKPLPEAQPE